MSQNETCAFSTNDIEYLRHGDHPLLARVFAPQGAGPFPMVVEIHGGAWNEGTRENDTVVNEALARSGIVVAALDFRQPPEASYPGSLVDINYAVRWLKANAQRFNGDPARTGAVGFSSGAHQAMITAMRPTDPRYAWIPLPPGSPAVDARLAFVVLGWPVIDPLGRYEFARDHVAAGRSIDQFKRLMDLQERFWGSEETMAEANPVRILERGERAEMPPAVYIQGTDDAVHPRPHADRFIAAYGRAGGSVHLELFQGQGENFIRKDPTGAEPQRAIRTMIEFIHAQGR